MRASAFISTIVFMGGMLSCGDPVVNLPEPLVIVNTSVNDGGFVDSLEPTLVFGFNKPITKASIEKDGAFELELAEGGGDAPALEATLPQAAGSASAWNTIEVMPVQPLEQGTKYVLTISAKVITADDGTKLETDYVFHFQTE